MTLSIIVQNNYIKRLWELDSSEPRYSHLVDLKGLAFASGGEFSGSVPQRIIQSPVVGGEITNNP
tara:strand:+ start:969 stop:1163 length:195 start_codon:yes stop_codon:yes gene_type:complete